MPEDGVVRQQGEKPTNRLDLIARGHHGIGVVQIGRRDRVR